MGFHVHVCISGSRNYSDPVATHHAPLETVHESSTKRPAGSDNSSISAIDDPQIPAMLHFTGMF